jgi:two-component system sensor histidine kinase BaeS
MLLSFLLSLLTFLLITAGIFYIGYRRSITNWSNERRNVLEEQVRKEVKNVLSRMTVEAEAELESKLRMLIPNNVPVTIYNTDRKVVYDSRGPGMGGGRRMRYKRLQQDMSLSQSLTPVQENKEIVGYYTIGRVHFGLESANARFLESMRRTIWISIGCSFVLAFLFALLLSKKLSDSAQTVSKGINQMALGKLNVIIPERGVKEISLIAKSANELARKLESEEIMRRQWAADIAHDLRTPVAALKSQFEGMVDGVFGVTKDRIEKNMGELLRIETLINDLGELTRLESPEMKINPVKIDTGIFFKELNNRFVHEFEKKGISVRWGKGVDTFTGDENLVLRAVSNFISNAVRHTPAGGKIDIDVRKNKNDYTISVYNSGKGIPESEIDKVFNRLFRGEYARKTTGSGLGLTIAKKIAELHGGGATIKSSDNSGTTIEMSIRR